MLTATGDQALSSKLFFLIFLPQKIQVTTACNKPMSQQAQTKLATLTYNNLCSCYRTLMFFVLAPLWCSGIFNTNDRTQYV